MQGARGSEAGFTFQAGQRGSVPGAAQTGGAQRPPEDRVQPVQVSHTMRVNTSLLVLWHSSQWSTACE